MITISFLALGGIFGLVIYLIVLLLVFWLLYYLVNNLAPEPMRKILNIVLIVLFVIAAAPYNPPPGYVLRITPERVSPGRIRKLTTASARPGSTLSLLPPDIMVNAVVVRSIALVLALFSS